MKFTVAIKTTICYTETDSYDVYNETVDEQQIINKAIQQMEDFDDTNSIKHYEVIEVLNKTPIYYSIRLQFSDDYVSMFLLKIPQARQLNEEPDEQEITNIINNRIAKQLQLYNTKNNKNVFIKNVEVIEVDDIEMFENKVL